MYRMLPPSYCHSYQKFAEALAQLQTRAASGNGEVAEIKAGCRQVQEIFQAQIATLNGNDLDISQVSRWQSFQTEIYKQLRLLEMDVTFLQASRQLDTIQKRQEAISDRITMIIAYCEAIQIPLNPP